MNIRRRVERLEQARKGRIDWSKVDWQMNGLWELLDTPTSKVRYINGTPWQLNESAYDKKSPKEWAPQIKRI